LSRNSAFALIILVLSIWGGWVVFLLSTVGSEFTSPSAQPFEAAGQFGDAFGVLASLMSALAIIGALYSIHVQSRNNDRQHFESNFYNLLDNYTRQRDNVSMWIMGKPLSDKLYGKAEYHGLKRVLRKQEHLFQGARCFQIQVVRLRDLIGLEGFSDTKFVGRKYREVMANGDSILLLFRLLYHIVTIIDRSGMDDKYYYTRILRAHISQSEFCLLAYNCVVGEGREKFRPLIERYSLLHNLKKENLDSHQRAELRFFQRKFDNNAFRFEAVEPVKY